MDTTMATTSERVELITPLGEELLFHGLRTREELSRLGEYQLDLLSKNKAVDRDKILGGKVTIKVSLQDGEVRYFNGFVTRFSAGASLGRYARYSATVSPWLWFLTRTADCRIFQDKTIQQIIEEVFADHPGVADFAFELSESYSPWKYCVQYRETDFNFVSRLMEHEGMYYYFRQTDGHHTLVITDSTDKHDPAKGYETLQFIAPQVLVRPGTEYISAWHISREVQPGAYAQEDYDFERPSVDLTTMKTLPRNYSPSDYEVYDYPGFYVQKPDGERYAHVRIDEYGAMFETAEAETNYRGVRVGARFTLEGHDVGPINGDYLVVAATHKLESSQYESGDEAGTESGFSCSFTALSCSQQFRPVRSTPKPFVHGPQTAVVTGPAGDEIYTDKYGRVKVQFHWDRKGKKDENSSCWIRVSHPWAGKGWGAVATPRIGQEVIVDFLEGDPDQPIITGRVYNEENQPPFGFPAGAVLSGVKSDTHKGGGYNEMSFDDTAGTEKITIHGQYDMNTTVEHDQTSTVHNCRTDAIDVDDSETVGNNQTWSVGVNRDATIGSNETLAVGADRTKSVGANETITVGANRDATIGASETLTVAATRTHTVGVNEAISIGAAQEITVGAMQAITVGAMQAISVGAAQNVSVGANQSTNVGASQVINVASNQSTSAGGNVVISAGAKFSASAGSDFAGSAGGKMGLKAGGDLGASSGGKVAVTAASELTLVCGGASIVLKSGGQIQIKGTDITINGSGKITVKAGGDVVLKGSKIGQN
jgi:type VI secretion system secreted protein VgrG